MRYLALLLLLTGCTSNPIQGMMEAIGKDPATVCAKVVYGPAVAQLYRTNSPNARVKCDNDGMEVTSPPQKPPDG